MKRLVGFMMILAGCIVTTACDNDNRPAGPGNEAVEITFTTMFPDAKKVEWEIIRGYYIADFHNKGHQAEAWFDGNGKWYMTVTELGYNELPQAIKNSFLASQWAQWKIDDCDIVEREGVDTVYVLEAESGNNEVRVVYSQSGELLKVTEQKYGNHTMPDAKAFERIKTFISEKYPSSKILNLEYENNRIEADILDSSVKREVTFTGDGIWTYTETDVNKMDVPANVTETLMNSEYADYTIDDIDFIESPAGNYYLFELEKGNTEVRLKIDEQGNIIK